MIVKSLSAIFIFLLTLSFNAASREAVPVIEHINIPVQTGSGQPVTLEQVRNAISLAAAANQWEISKSENSNLISAKLLVRGKHTVVVSIPYSTEQFSIKYQSSINMKYEIAEGSPTTFPGTFGHSSSKQVPEGTAVIHPFYNKWVGILLSSIQAELRKL